MWNTVCNSQFEATKGCPRPDGPPCMVVEFDISTQQGSPYYLDNMLRASIRKAGTNPQNFLYLCKRPVISQEEQTASVISHFLAVSTRTCQQCVKKCFLNCALIDEKSLLHKICNESNDRSSDKENCKCSKQTSSIFIDGAQFAFKSCIYIRCIQCHLVDMTLDAPKINTTFEGEFETLN